MCAPERMSTVKIIVDSPRSYHDEILTVVFFLYVYADSSKWPALEYHLGTIFLMIARRPNVLHPVNMHTCVLHDQVVAQMNSWFHEFDQGLTRLCWPIWCKMAWCRGVVAYYRLRLSPDILFSAVVFIVCDIERAVIVDGGDLVAHSTHNVERYPSVFVRSHT